MNLLAYPLITYNKYKTFTLERVAIFIFISCSILYLCYICYDNKTRVLNYYIMLSDAYWIKYPEHNWALIWLSKKIEL